MVPGGRNPLERPVRDFDGRILGSCDFVKTLREEDAVREGLSQPFSLAELQKSVAAFSL
jgi:hypothetical protein